VLENLHFFKLRLKASCVLESNQEVLKILLNLTFILAARVEEAWENFAFIYLLLFLGSFSTAFSIAFCSCLYFFNSAFSAFFFSFSALLNSFCCFFYSLSSYLLNFVSAGSSLLDRFFSSSSSLPDSYSLSTLEISSIRFVVNTCLVIKRQWSIIQLLKI